MARAWLFAGFAVQAPAEQIQIFVEFVEQQLGLFCAGRRHAALHFVETLTHDGQAFFDEFVEARRTGLSWRGAPFGCAVGQLATEDADVFRRVDAEADDAFFDAHHLNSGFQAGEDEGFVLTTGQDKHVNTFTKQQGMGKTDCGTRHVWARMREQSGGLTQLLSGEGAEGVKREVVVRPLRASHRFPYRRTNVLP